MDISKYKFYIRDIGISDDNLTQVLQDVVNDIALSTKIFKRMFGFTIEPNIKIYNMKELLAMSQFVQDSDINNLTIGSYTEEKLINFLSDPTNLVINVESDVNVGVDKDLYFYTLDILTEEDNTIISIFDLFDTFNNELFSFKKTIEKSIGSICICTVIPNINNITDDIEIFLRPAIIEGLKYYTDTNLNPQSVNTDINSYKKFVNAKLELQNKFPTYIGKQIKRSII